MAHWLRRRATDAGLGSGRNRRRGWRGSCAVLVTVVISAGLPGFGGTAHAISNSRGNDFTDPPTVGGDVFDAPANGFNWSVSSRFGPSDKYGLVDYHYCAPERYDSEACAKTGLYTYDPAWVHPTALTANFDGCPTSAEEDAAPGATTYTYTWSLPGTSTSVSQNNCHFSHDFPVDGNGQGTPTAVRLSITDANGNTPSVVQYPSGQSYFEQTVTVRDYLVVSFGDSYGSGEGNPDKPQVLSPCGFLNLGTCVTSPPMWEDQRCHRSASAAAAQAALQLEAADTHSSVTFISFACSGATINTVTAANENPLDPYAPVDGSQDVGSGVLGPYRGVEPGTAPYCNGIQASNFDPCTFLPDQITQMKNAVGTRRIDALLGSAGGNDMGFARVATVCVLAAQCQNRQVTNADDSGPISLDSRVKYDVGQLANKYDALATALNNSGLNVTRFYPTEYPDPTRNDAGGYCGAILYDVIPAWLQVVTGVLMAALFPAMPAALANGLAPPFEMSNDPILGNEVQWAGDLIPSSLHSTLAAASARYATVSGTNRVPWEMVGGIAADFQQDGSGHGHGYCASDSWIRSATDATTMQGPWGNAANEKTKGTLHPTAAGHLDIANHIFRDHLLSELLPPPPPAGPPPAPRITSTSTLLNADGSVAAQSVEGANGWLTGCSGPSCSANAPVLQLVAADAAGIRGAGLTINGAVAHCPATGTTVGTVTCTGVLSSDRLTYTWTLGFPADGTFHLAGSVTARNGTQSSIGRDVKVDLHDPSPPVATASSAIPPANGWYRTPVDIAFDGTDPTGGSGVQGIWYQVDNGAPALVPASSQIPAGTDPSTAQAHIASDGVHTVTFWSQDWAGRTAAPQSLTVSIDTAAPAVNCDAADGSWHASDVAVGCTAADSGSGLASASDGTFSLATAVPSGTETGNASTGARTVCDVAGNCATAGPVTGNKIDKKPPVIAVASPGPSASYFPAQVVAASYGCTDNGSGVASCTGTVANGSSIDTASVGQKTFTVNSADNVGNTADAVNVPYTVTYRICPQYNSTTPVNAGSTLPVKLQICTASGNNLSAQSIVLTATDVVNVATGATTAAASPGSANAGGVFRFSGGAYIFNLKTASLPAGDYLLRFSIAGDPVVHAAAFAVR